MMQGDEKRKLKAKGLIRVSKKTRNGGTETVYFFSSAICHVIREVDCRTRLSRLTFVFICPRPTSLKALSSSTPPYRNIPRTILLQLRMLQNWILSYQFMSRRSLSMALRILVGRSGTRLQRVFDSARFTRPLLRRVCRSGGQILHDGRYSCKRSVPIGTKVPSITEPCRWKYHVIVSKLLPSQSRAGVNWGE